jgi:hypothetical protein
MPRPVRDQSARNLSTSLVGTTTVHPAIKDFTAPRVTMVSISLVLTPSRPAASLNVRTPTASLPNRAGAVCAGVGTYLGAD